MNPERWRELERIFLEALEREPAERSDFVRAACGEDAELREELLRMLGVGEPEPRFLAPPTPPPSGELPASVGQRRLGDFELLEEIGSGGMGIVFRAWQRSLGREVAVKVLPASLTLASRQVERFYREARAVAKLSHPGIVSILTVGREGDTNYFAMELVDGHDLSVELAYLREEIAAEELDRAQLPSSHANHYFREVARIVREVADALHYAHQHGIVHRDVKPSNLLIDRTGAVRVVDFGLARDVEQGSITRTGDLAGTPHYMSPEQARARQLLIDHRTDVYSLGVVLYELLTLERPFTGDTSQEILTKIMREDPPPIRRLNGRVPRDLEVVCNMAMAKLPKDRYLDAAALRDDLDRFLAHQAIVARPPAWGVRLARMARRRRVPLIGAAAVVVASLAGFRVSEALARSRELDALLARVEHARAVDFAQLPPGRQGDVRAALAELAAVERELSPGARAHVRGVAERVEAYRRTLLEEGSASLARSSDASQPEGVREMSRLGGLALLVHGASLFPEDPELARLARAESAYPTLTVRAEGPDGEPLDAVVSLMPVDPLTGGVGAALELGRAPLVAEPVLPGPYRVVVSFADGGSQELSTYPGPGRMKDELSAVRRGDDASVVADMVWIEGATYAYPDRRETPECYRGRTVEVASFWIDRTEVSNADYLAFVNATGRDRPWNWDLIEDLDAFLAEHGQRPVAGVTHEEASAYAAWRGKRLPTAAEWLLAAGGPEHRPKPYPGAPGGAPRANVSAPDRSGIPREEGYRRHLFQEYLAHTVAVDSMPEAATPEGVLHLWGNVEEHTDSIAVTLEPGAESCTPRTHDRFFLGGAWHAAARAQSMYQMSYIGAGKEACATFLGFRCAKGGPADQ